MRANSDRSWGDRVFTPQPGHKAAHAIRTYNFAPLCSHTPPVAPIGTGANVRCCAANG
jgi:hypothetical protein